MGTSQTTIGDGQGGSGFSQADAVANLKATAAAEVAQFNTELTSEYQTTYQNYVDRMRSGGALSQADQQVPVPPSGYSLTLPDVNGYVFPQISGLPVCPPGQPVAYLGGLSPTSGLVENTIDIGVQLAGGSYYSVGPKDTWPANRNTPPLPAGPTFPAGVYQKIPAPVGSLSITWPDGSVGVHGGWYLKVG